jgi:hypothetical protein
MVVLAQTDKGLRTALQERNFGWPSERLTRATYPYFGEPPRPVTRGVP